MKKYFIGLGFWGRLFVFLTLTVFLMLGAIIVGDILAYFIYGRDALANQEVPVMQFLQAFLSIGLFLLPPVLMVKLCCEGSLRDNLMLSKPIKLLPLCVSVAAMLVSAPMVTWLEEVNLQMTLPDCMADIENWMRDKEDSAAKIVDKFTKSPDPLRYVINLVVLALLPGLSEEMCFRVGVQTRLFGDKTRIQGYWAVVLTAILFSAIHLQFYGFLPRLVLGVVLGVFLLITGNVWYSILAHFVNNMIAVTLAFMEARGVEMTQPQWLGSWWMALLSAMATVALLVVLSRIEKMTKKF